MTIDEPTFAAVWREHATRIEAYLRPRVGDAAEDLAQDTFLKAWRCREQYDPTRGPVIGWLHGIAGRVVVDFYRTAGRRPVEVCEADDRTPDTAPDMADRVGDRELVTAALAALPEAQRVVLAHRYLADRSVADTAAALELPDGTVKSMCARALAALRKALGVVTPTAHRPKRPRLADPIPAPEPARSTAVAPHHAHRRPHRRDRPHHAGHRCARAPQPVGSPGVPGPRHPHQLHRTATGRAAAVVRDEGRPDVRACPAGPDPLRRRVHPQPRRHGHLAPCSVRRQGGDQVMTPDQFGWAIAPWVLCILVMYCGYIAAKIYDDGIAVQRRRAQRNRELGLKQRDAQFATGRSAAATETAVIPRYLPEPPEPGPGSPIWVEPGEVESGDEPDPLVEQPEPAPSGRVWPVPQLLPQPSPEPVEAVLYEATGQYPVLDDAVLHSGMTGAFTIPAEIRALFEAVA